jgi:hypothetical protein
MFAVTAFPRSRHVAVRRVCSRPPCPCFTSILTSDATHLPLASVTRCMPWPQLNPRAGLRDSRGSDQTRGISHQERNHARQHDPILSLLPARL